MWRGGRRIREQDVEAKDGERTLHAPLKEDAGRELIYDPVINTN